jgi:hypothetical protein
MIKNELKATRESNGADRIGAEEDIKILEDFIYEMKSFGLTKDTLEVSNALEHLIKSYKELEEENQQLEAIKDEAIRRYNFESIPVSLVEETIEELKNEDLEIYDTDSEDLIIAKYEQRAILDFLQELLERRK